MIELRSCSGIEVLAETLSLTPGNVFVSFSPALHMSRGRLSRERQQAKGPEVGNTLACSRNTTKSSWNEVKECGRAVREEEER